jgi:hypothetical protein
VNISVTVTELTLGGEGIVIEDELEEVAELEYEIAVTFE